jgi:hypothetical protein
MLLKPKLPTSSMAKKRSRLLVIDASVAHAAGPEDATHPTAKHCRDFLLAVSDICHRMAVSAAIDKEWNKHQSGFARRWRRSMFAKKKINRVECGADDGLRKELEEAGANEKQIIAMLKDVHLIEAARAADSRIVALDEVVRHLFRQAASSVSTLRGIFWVNPDIEKESPLKWLEDGAPAQQFRRLDHAAAKE